MINNFNSQFDCTPVCRASDGHDIKLFIWGGWGRNWFVSVARSFGVVLVVIFPSAILVVSFDSPGGGGGGRLQVLQFVVSVESSAQIHVFVSFDDSFLYDQNPRPLL